MPRVTIYNLSVCVKADSQNLINDINDFLRRFYRVKTVQFGQANIPEEKIFASVVPSQAEFWLHTNQFLHLRHELGLNGFSFDGSEVIDKREYTPEFLDYKTREGLSLRPHQVPAVEFITKEPVRSKLLPLATGSGKTFSSLFALAQVKMLIGIVIVPTYIEKWVKDIVEGHETTIKDIMVIQGSKSLRGLIAMAQEGSLRSKYYVFSSRTMQEFISAYEDNPDQCKENYGCLPVELFPLVGIGSLLVDEAHQHFHAIFKILLHANVVFQLGLTATLLSDDSVVSRVHRVVYPDKVVYDAGALDKYADVYALGYFMPPDLLKKVKTTQYGSNSYSHNAFEQSVMRFPPLKMFMMSLLYNAIEDFFVGMYEKGDKLMIFVGMVKYADYVVGFIKHYFPKFSVNRYCDGDPLQNVYEADIIVTTIISAGTAIDIPGLRAVIQTVSVSSSVANIQNLGRLRKIPNKDVRFVYLFAENINKQKMYHYKRLELFRERVASHRTFRARATPIPSN